MLLSVPAPEAGEIDQVTPFCPGSGCTVAVKVWLLPAGTVAVPGETETALAGTVRVALADIEVLETDVAVTVTTTSVGGGAAGALYVAEVLVMLLSVPAPEAGEIDQVTPAFAGSF